MFLPDSPRAAGTITLTSAPTPPLMVTDHGDEIRLGDTVALRGSYENAGTILDVTSDGKLTVYYVAGPRTGRTYHVDPDEVLAKILAYRYYEKETERMKFDDYTRTDGCTPLFVGTAPNPDAETTDSTSTTSSDSATGQI